MNKNLTLISNEINQLPNNIEAEQAVIGSVLTSNEIFDDISSIISEVNFYDPLHQRIYSAINNLIYKGMLANPITLKSYFENGKNVSQEIIDINKNNVKTKTKSKKIEPKTKQSYFPNRLIGKS